MAISSRISRPCFIVLFSIILLLTRIASLMGQAENAQIHILTIDGIISPISSRYLIREIDRAHKDKSQAVILILNTPGGLESSTRDMTRAMLNAPIPVVVFVAPGGAHAASAGMFITLAGHIAAMAPGTNIGAAHPVALDQREQAQNPDDPVRSKIVEDVAALARSIAVSRGRNATWAENAVRKSVSITAEEALDAKVIDLVAKDLPELLEKIDGRTVTLPDRSHTLKTRETQHKLVPMNLPERILQAITNPNVAYMLMTIAMIGIIAELYNPGTFFPGITGLISLLLALSALGSLPLSWAGLALLLLGIILMVLELYTEGLGILGVLGLIGFVLGSLFLYQPLEPVSPTLPKVEVNRWLIFFVAALLFLLITLILRSVLRIRKAPPAMGRQLMIGKQGVVTSELKPKGVVSIEGEHWSAIDMDQPEHGATLGVGHRVQVVGMEGLTLKVKSLDDA
jgi:membrane-bound serine protease (ClpP class)